MNAEILAKLLGISVSSSYELMHEKDFPAIRIGSLLVVPKEKLQHYNVGLMKKQESEGEVLSKNYLKRDPIKDYFPLPNEIFYLDLSFGEIAVYSYLLYRENRKYFQCYPSYKTIGKALKMSRNTVGKYVRMLVDKELIVTEPTSVYTKDNKKLNENLLYTILPIKQAKLYFYKRQLENLNKIAAESKLKRKAEHLGINQAIHS